MPFFLLFNLSSAWDSFPPMCFCFVFFFIYTLLLLTQKQKRKKSCLLFPCFPRASLNRSAYPATFASMHRCTPVRKRELEYRCTRRRFVFFSSASLASSYKCIESHTYIHIHTCGTPAITISICGWVIVVRWLRLSF